MSVESELQLSAFEQSDGIYLISRPQRFAGGEEIYDEHIGDALRDDRLRSGRGAWRFLCHYATRPVRTLLEIGAGSGSCSLGLFAAAPDIEIVVTDTSAIFLEMTRRKIVKANLPIEHAHFATLAGEDLSRLPAGNVDAIVIASALHHVSDWQRFLKDSAALLRPGGVLVIQEPCREGNLMMGLALDFVLSPLWPAGILDQTDIDRITRCRDSIYHLADTSIPKEGEDKHTFLVTELVAAADAAGFVGTAFYSNVHFADLLNYDLSKRQALCSFSDYLDSFLAMHHRVSERGMQVLRERLFPIMQRLDARFRNGDGAALLGCMAFQR